MGRNDSALNTAAVGHHSTSKPHLVEVAERGLAHPAARVVEQRNDAREGGCSAGRAVDGLVKALSSKGCTSRRAAGRSAELAFYFLAQECTRH